MTDKLSHIFKVVLGLVVLAGIFALAMTCTLFFAVLEVVTATFDRLINLLADG